MSLTLDTGAMKYRENPNQPWRPLVIKADMNWESMADTYDPDNGTYEVGQYVLEEGVMYRCVYAIDTPETWTPAHWTETNIGDEILSLKGSIASEAATRASEDTSIRNTLNAVENGIAIIVNGDTCTTAVPVGGYAYIKNNTHGLAEGLYTNTSASAFPTSGGTANSSVFTAVSDGGLNSLKNSLLKYKDTSSSVTFAFNSTNSSLVDIASNLGIAKERIILCSIYSISGWSTYVPLIVYEPSTGNVIAYIQGTPSFSATARVRAFYI